MRPDSRETKRSSARIDGRTLSNRPAAAAAAGVAAETPHAFRIGPPSEGGSAPAESAYGMRIGSLSQHARMFSPGRGDVHDSGKSLHARVRILFGAEGEASGRARCG